MNFVNGIEMELVQSSRKGDRAKDDTWDRVFLRPRPLVNPLIARWRFLERLAETGAPDSENGSNGQQNGAPQHAPPKGFRGRDDGLSR
jgi:hypothetical protein